LKEYLSNNGIEFTYVDLSANTLNLKTYLKYRDNFSAFDEVKKVGKIGIPTLMINNGEKFIFGELNPNIDDLR